MFLSLHVTCSSIFMHTYLHFCIFLYIDLFGAFLRVTFSPSLCLSLSLSFFLLLASWHINENPLHPKTLFILGHPLPLIPHLLLFGSVMIKPERTFRWTSLDKAFIQNTKSSYRISPIQTFPLSSTVGVRRHCVASWSCALLWSYRSFTPTCIDLITLYPSLSYRTMTGRHGWFHYCFFSISIGFWGWELQWLR